MPIAMPRDRVGDRITTSESVARNNLDINKQRTERLDARQVEQAKKSGVRRPNANVDTTTSSGRKMTGPPRKGSFSRQILDAKNAERSAARSRTNISGSNAALARRSAPGQTSTDRLGGRTGSVVGGGKVTTSTVPGSAGSMSTTPADARANKIEGRDLARAQTDLKAADARQARNVGRGSQPQGGTAAQRSQVVIDRTLREMTREQNIRKATGGSIKARPAGSGTAGTGSRTNPRRGLGLTFGPSGGSGGSPARLSDKLR